MAVAYSYVRFSSKEQETGDSERRQIEDARKWCERSKVSLDTSFEMPVERGVSAFRGKHRENTHVRALGKFLEGVKSGRVQAGSYLIVESLDRLTREDPWTGIGLVANLVAADIRIVQLKPCEVIFEKGNQAMQVMLASMQVGNAHNYSALLSERVDAAWKNKKKKATEKVVTRKLPGWIKAIGGEGKKMKDTAPGEVRFTLDEEKASTIRRIFELAIKGVGGNGIAKELNDGNVPLIARKKFKGKALKWNQSAVWNLLNSRTVLGEYQQGNGRGKERVKTSVIADYYPRVIDDDTWHAAQNALKTRNRVGRGRKGLHVNLFAGLLFDARDDGHLTYKHYKGKLGLIEPHNAREHDISWASFNSNVFEQCLLSELREVKADEINGNNDASRLVESLSGQLAEVRELVRVWQGKMNNVAIADMVAEKLTELRGQERELAEKIASAQRDAASPISESWGEFRSLAELLKKDNSKEMRERVRNSMRRSISSVHCLLTKRGRVQMCEAQVWFTNGSVREYLLMYEKPRNNASVKHEPRIYCASTKYSEKVIDLRRPGHWEVVQGMIDAMSGEQVENLLSQGK